MAESISEIVIRLAREQLAAETGAPGPSMTEFQPAPSADFLPADLQRLPAAEPDGHELETAMTSSPDHPSPLFRKGGAVDAALGAEVSYEINSRANESSSEGAFASLRAVPFKLDEQALRQSTDDTSLYSS